MLPDGEFSSFLLETYLLREVGELASNESSLPITGNYSIV
jgi:hypothetical protein